jgi:hypothetical protein
MREIKHIGVLPAAIFGGLLSLVTSAVGEVLVVFGSLALLGPIAGSFGRGGGPLGGLLPLVGRFVLLAPIFNGVLGFVITGLCCWFYNLSAPVIGGIKVELG